MRSHAAGPCSPRDCLAAAILVAAALSTSAAGPPNCETGSSGGPVQAPVFVRNLAGQTSWFASPVIADLDGDASRELIAAYYDVFVFSPDGSSYQPVGGHTPAWPRYNNLSGPGNDADRNGPGHSGFGCYGLNVGIGDIDDDRPLTQGNVGLRRTNVWYEPYDSREEDGRMLTAVPGRCL